MKIGDKVKSSGKYADIQSRFGDSTQTVRFIANSPVVKKKMVWLECGGGAFMADGFEVVSGGDEIHS